MADTKNLLRFTAAALIALAAVFAFATPAQSGDFKSVTAPCSSIAVAQQVVDQRVAELQETGKSGWVVRDLSVTNPGAGGATFGGNVAIDDDTPCAFLESMVNHEWAHIQQHRQYPVATASAYGGPEGVERVAGCVAYLFGAPDRPAVRNCTAVELDAARQLIDTVYVK